MTTEKTFRARVHIFPRPEILDPQGKAIAGALERLGFSGVASVRAGKVFDLELQAANEEAAELLLQKMGVRLLANPVVEDFTVAVLGEVAAGAAAGGNES